MFDRQITLDTRIQLFNHSKCSSVMDEGERERVRSVIRAIQQGGEDAVAVVTAYLREGGNPNGGAPAGAGSLLATAVDNHNYEVCKILLDTKADPNFCGRFSRPALHIAAKKRGHMDIFTLLLDRGANINLKYINGNTALLEAVVSQDIEKVQEMIKRGGDVKVANNGGDTGLHMASLAGNDTILKEFLAAGLPFDVVKYQGPKKVSNTGIQPIHNSAYGPRGGNAHITKILLEAGADPDAAMSNGRTTLHLAAMRNAVFVANVLIAHGCTIDPISMENEEHKTPLMKAIDNSHLDMVDRLIDAGADLELGDQWGCSPLVVAVFNAKIDIVMALLDAGCDVNHKARNGLRPFDFAIRNPQVITQMLVLAGCKLDHDLRENCVAPRPEEKLLGYPELLEWILGYAEGPRSLTQLCRLQIRNILGRCPQRKIDTLPIPTKAKEYLNFADIHGLIRNSREEADSEMAKSREQ